MAKRKPETADDLRQYTEKLRQLKKLFENAVKDEDQAAKMYSGMINLAQDLYLSYEESKVRSIREQELYHAEIYKKLIRGIDTAIAANEKEIKRLEQEEERKESLSGGRHRGALLGLMKHG